MAENNNERSFVEIEDELNTALGRIGEKSRENLEEKIASLTVQELLEQLKIDEFEKIYITTSVQSNSPTNEQIPEEKMNQIKTLAEYKLSQMDMNEKIDLEDQEKLKAASNFYLIPHTVNHRYNVGNVEQTKTMEVYTVNDVEGHSLYTIIDNQNISISTGFKDKIKEYLEENYKEALELGNINIDDVVDYFSPQNTQELYNMLGNEAIISVRFLPSRIDEFVKEKGIEVKGMEYDNLDENEQAGTKEQPENDKDEVLEDSDAKNGIIKDKSENNLEEIEEEKTEKVESYIEKIARLNHVKPTVVNTRVVENFEKVEEDIGIHLKGRYTRGEVIAVRIPYKLGYRTFLAEKSTGLTIDGKGRIDRTTGKLYDYDEIEDYFRYKLRNGQDGGESGKPLRRDEGRDYTTYLDEHGDIKEEKFINNGKRKRYA